MSKVSWTYVDKVLEHVGATRKLTKGDSHLLSEQIKKTPTKENNNASRFGTLVEVNSLGN